MRHIEYNPLKLILPNEWESRATKLKDQLEKEPDEKKRGKLIKANTLWKEIKPQLAKISANKCWYTDSLQVGTDVDVDHYRPKNNVAELRENVPQHPGYWWLAYNLENYRFSCIFANRRRVDVETNKTGGKSDHFPVIDESKRAWNQSFNYEDEMPLLLDPCKLSDVRLLAFKEDGEAMPRANKTNRPNEYNRAEVSIILYNLNHSEFVNQRLILRDQIRDVLKRVRRFYNKLETGDAVHAEAYEQAILDLRRLCDKKSAFSSFCIAYLENFRHEDCLDGVL